MDAQSVPLNRETARLFVQAVKHLLTSEVRRRAIGLLLLLLLFALAVNGLNVVGSYVGRDFMTAISQRDMPGFSGSPLCMSPFSEQPQWSLSSTDFCEERMGLLWRSWLTKRVIERYLDQRTYLRLKESAQIDNPDQRITEDIRAFTTTTLSFMLVFLNSTLAALSFAAVLWTISPLLFFVAVGYAGLGTLMTVLLGRPLVG
jgi:putative ATP-binding cassette transporter